MWERMYLDQASNILRHSAEKGKKWKNANFFGTLVF